jgi:hypothetical protein
VRCAPAAEGCEKWTNLLTAADFLRHLPAHKTLRFEFEARLFGGEPVSAACSIDVDDDLFKSLAVNGWAAPVCWESVPHGGISAS